MSDIAKRDYLPDSPYPGIEPFSYAGRNVFFARGAEARTLVRLIVIYRGVLLYSDSGIGKSSLVNAGLIPLAIDEGYQPERIRVQPRRGGEIIVERLSEKADGEPPFLPSIFAPDERQEHVVLSVEKFLETLRQRARAVRPLLIKTTGLPATSARRRPSTKVRPSCSPSMKTAITPVCASSAR